LGATVFAFFAYVLDLLRAIWEEAAARTMTGASTDRLFHVAVLELFVSQSPIPLVAAASGLRTRNYGTQTSSTPSISLLLAELHDKEWKVAERWRLKSKSMPSQKRVAIDLAQVRSSRSSTGSRSLCRHDDATIASKSSSTSV